MQEIKVLQSSFTHITYGKNVTLVQPSNLYGCTLEDDVFVGPFCEIQRDVFIGKRTRVQSHSFICSLVHIGEDCFIGHGVMFINDRFSLGTPAPNATMWERTYIGNRVSIGSNATILPVSICDDVVIGAGAVITRSITQSGYYAGNPARCIRPLNPTPTQSPHTKDNQ
ncbi:acyltransferase [Helicobacter sp. MIT 21-1697]|uniref:acyltransferase n=1 Tax=Helicobacter sp. MIT 21-1697 TaxID=2993733 RepID=UPI00224A67BA|nr:acyltransferase [Helicobacter sp. MIT 21-1697]MCX2717712.1 acyltransferase [Helicobacter sp. MIT 21-1697]